MTRMKRPDCAVMCNLINTHTHTRTHLLRQHVILPLDGASLQIRPEMLRDAAGLQEAVPAASLATVFDPPRRDAGAHALEARRGGVEVLESLSSGYTLPCSQIPARHAFPQRRRSRDATGMPEDYTLLRRRRSVDPPRELPTSKAPNTLY